MTHLPKKSSMANFQPADLEGKWLFNQGSQRLDSLFSNAWLQDFAQSQKDASLSVFAVPDREVGGQTKKELSDDELRSALALTTSKLAEIHEWQQKIIGFSKERREDVPVMSYTQQVIDRRKKTDAATRELSELLRNKPYVAEDVAKEVFHVALLEIAKLDYVLKDERALPMLKEMDAARTHMANAAMQPFSDFGMKPTQELTSAKFTCLKAEIAAANTAMQKDLGVQLPQEEIATLVHRPIDAPLSRMVLKEIRQNFFQMPAEVKANSSDVKNLLLKVRALPSPGADGRAL